MSDEKKVTKKEELQQAYLAWTGEEAQAIEREGAKTGEMYMVIVNRFMYVSKQGKAHLHRSEYPFNTLEVAKRCEAYWFKRKGIVTLLTVKVLTEWGYVDEPDLYGHS